MWVCTPKVLVKDCCYTTTSRVTRAVPRRDSATNRVSRTKQDFPHRKRVGTTRGGVRSATYVLVEIYRTQLEKGKYSSLHEQGKEWTTVIGAATRGQSGYVWIR
jgi:hypothetical protein